MNERSGHKSHIKQLSILLQTGFTLLQLALIKKASETDDLSQASHIAKSTHCQCQSTTITNQVRQYSTPTCAAVI